VYCLECHFIDSSDYPDGYETDEFDEHSLHFGAFDYLGRLVGTTRLILPTCEKFPIEERCAGLPGNGWLPPRRECAEVSRLVINKFYRQLVQDQAPVIRRVSPLVLGLCRAMYAESHRMGLGIKYCYALMEKPLMTLLKFHGFHFKPLGPEIDFFGPVTPYLFDVSHHEQSEFGILSKAQPGSEGALVS
jgi:N-acyl amino acid synthase of PEP-CTERM/exosortase system